MFRQEIDPLADTIPPRYAYESDEEDELVDFPVSASTGTPSVDVTIVLGEGCEPTEGHVLIVASGEAGAVWARGAQLGEQAGQVSVNKRAIGLVFRPPWAASSVIVSEALAKLPVWAMHAYAAAVLGRWKPSKLVIIDAYSTATYISASPIAHHEAPLRYLQTGSLGSAFKSPSPHLKLFAPPNLLQSTTAAFLSILALSQQSSSTSALAILVPSPRAPKPVPHTLNRIDADSESDSLASLEDLGDWDPAVLRTVHGALQHSAACRKSTEWQEGGLKTRSGRAPARRRVGEIEESMYI